MEWFVEPFEPEFMQRALLAGLLTVVTTSLIGTWVVIRGLAFIGDALAHGVLPGLALAFLWDLNLAVGALGSAAVMILGMSVVRSRTRLSEDTGIGLLFVGMLALGVIIISRSSSYAGDLTSLLFGSPLSVTTTDLAYQAGVAVAVLVLVAVLYRPLLVLSFNEQKARLLGFRPRATHALLLALLAVAVVASFRTVGTLLVFGLLIAPPATAALVTRRVPVMMPTAIAFGVLAVYLGLLVSYHADTAAGATMSGVAVAIFFVVLAGRDVLARVRPPAPSVAA